MPKLVSYSPTLGNNPPAPITPATRDLGECALFNLGDEPAQTSTTLRNINDFLQKFADVPEEFLERYSYVYPLCRSCKGRGYSFEIAREYKGGKAKKAKATV